MSRSNKSIRIRDIAIQTNKKWNKNMRESTIHVWLREWNSFGIFGEVELATNTLDTQWCPPILDLWVIQTKRAVTDRISVRSETSCWYVDPRCSMLSTSRSYSACRRISSRIGRFRSPPVRTYKLLFLCDYLILSTFPIQHVSFFWVVTSIWCWSGAIPFHWRLWDSKRQAMIGWSSYCSHLTYFFSYVNRVILYWAYRYHSCSVIRLVSLLPLFLNIIIVIMVIVVVIVIFAIMAITTPIITPYHYHHHHHHCCSILTVIIVFALFGCHWPIGGHG